MAAAVLTMGGAVALVTIIAALAVRAVRRSVLRDD